MYVCVWLYVNLYLTLYIVFMSKYLVEIIKQTIFWKLLNNACCEGWVGGIFGTGF